MVTSLFKYERIRTTKAKALEIRRTAEKMITRAKLDSVHNRRIVGKDIKDQGILAKLFTDIGPRFKERPGGYTRVLKIGYRDGDAAQMVVLELVERDEAAEAEQSANRRERRRARAERRAAEDAAAEEAIAADEAAAADQAAVSESKDDSGGSTEDKQSGE